MSTKASFSWRTDLTGLRIVVTAGGTAEPIDPVRVITNLSTGKMGTAVATAATARGGDVTLISSAEDPTIYGLCFKPMSSVASLRDEVLRSTATADILVMAAAVSDFRVAARADAKIKKTGERLVLEFEPVPDFMCETRPELFKVGFAAEHAAQIDNAWQKFDTHGFDLVCANPIDEDGSGFGTETNRVTILEIGRNPVPLPCLPKLDAAHHILDHTLRAYRDRVR